MRFVNGLAGHELLIAFCFMFLVSQYAQRVTVFLIVIRGGLSNYLSISLYPLSSRFSVFLVWFSVWLSLFGFHDWFFFFKFISSITHM